MGSFFCENGAYLAASPTKPFSPCYKCFVPLAAVVEILLPYNQRQFVRVSGYWWTAKIHSRMSITHKYIVLVRSNAFKTLKFAVWLAPQTTQSFAARELPLLTTMSLSYWLNQFRIEQTTTCEAEIMPLKSGRPTLHLQIAKA